jgi:hypothetical protein
MSDNDSFDMEEAASLSQLVAESTPWETTQTPSHGNRNVSGHRDVFGFQLGTSQDLQVRTSLNH